MADNLPRTAVDRVLARAVELQAQQGTGGLPAAGETLSEAQLEELSKEVGIDVVHLRQALAEERTRTAVAEPSVGVLGRLYGPACVTAQRTVSGTPAQVLAALDDWMRREECLTPMRSFPERIVWESGRGLAHAVKRLVSGRGTALVGAREVSATAIAIDAQRTVVRLDADFRSRLRLAAEGHAASVVGMSLVGGVLGVLGFPLLIAAAPAPIAAAAGVAAVRSAQRRTLERAQLTLEQILDRLERGEIGRAPNLLGALAAAALRPPR